MSDGFSPEWLALREPADAAARAADLIGLVPGGSGTTVVHDLGCGTGSMGRWLAARLPGPQHWVMHDRDPALLAHARAAMITAAADGAPVTVETRESDITRLTAADLAGASLVTASALLDLLTADEVERVAAACVGAGAPALLTLSVAGRVELSPADPLDASVATAFDAHQRRDVDGRRLLGPDAVAVAQAAFTGLGAAVTLRESSWRLGPESSALTAEWLRGWVGAAVEHDPGLPGADYQEKRLRDATAGRLRAVIGHTDLFAG
jgi:SAM-dependent methyltransferase